MQLNQECILLQSELRKFAQQVILDKVDEFDKSCNVPADNVKQLAEMGILGALIPEDLGGAALDTIGLVVSLEEISKVCPSTALIIAVHNAFSYALLKYGNEEMKKKYLTAAASGDIIGGLAVFNTNMSTVERRNEVLTVNGTNPFVLNADLHGPFVMFLAHDTEHKNLSACVVDHNAPGVVIQKNETVLGLKAAGIGTVSFENCSIPTTALISTEQNGSTIQKSLLDLTNIYLAAIACGIAQGATDEAIKYAKDRMQFEQPIISFGMVREKIADMATQIEAGRLLTYNAAGECDAGRNYGRAASMARHFMGHAAVEITTSAIQVFGGYGYMKDYPMERYFRDAQVINVLCSTPAIEKEKIAKETIG